MSELFDLLVVGGGPAGYLCAERAAQNGMKVALFEKRTLGGTCLNEGCIPTKALLNSAKMYRHATESAVFGVTAANAVYDHARAVAHKDEVVQTLVSGIRATMSAEHVKLITGSAKIAGRTAEGFTVTANGVSYTGRYLTIASGSETVVPPVPGMKEQLDKGFVVTNREILDMKTTPRSLVVIGGGVIGLEMAYYFASTGASVTVIEMMPKIAGATDPEICRVLMQAFSKRKMTFKLSCKVLEIREHSVIYEENGQKQEIFCEKVLLSAGRRPATADFGLETLHLQMDRTAIITDRHLCTTVPKVYAIGDCNGKSMLAHTAYREAEVAVNHMLGRADEMRYDVIPSVIYTDPEVASVGLSRETAEERNMNVREIKLPMAYAGRYVAENPDGRGFLKLVVDPDRKRLVGCHMVGAYASEIIMTAAIMVDTELSPQRIQKLVFPHPTVSEIIREAIFHDPTVRNIGQQTPANEGSGELLTMFITGDALHCAEEAAKILSETYGIHAEIITLKSSVPLDYATLTAAVRKSGRVVLVSGDCAGDVFMNKVACLITERCFDDLDAAPVVIGTRNNSTTGERIYPKADWVIEAVHRRLLPLAGFSDTTD